VIHVYIVALPMQISIVYYLVYYVMLFSISELYLELFALSARNLAKLVGRSIVCNAVRQSKTLSDLIKDINHVLSEVFDVSVLILVSSLSYYKICMLPEKFEFLFRRLVKRPLLLLLPCPLSLRRIWLVYLSYY
jgi:hypothetical protein